MLKHDYPVEPVPFTAVHFNDAFWSPRIEVNRTVTIPFAFEQCEKSGRMWNFERAAVTLRGEEVKDKTPPGFPFDDTDVYKVIEGASYTLSVQFDPKLDAYIDGLIEKIAAAQEADGYLFTARTMKPTIIGNQKWIGGERWEFERELSHELYNLGHLYEAAVAHYQATGKRTLLDVALKTAELLDRTFGPDKRSIWPGHQITEMGLAKLYRTTGDERWLRMAKFLLDERGPGAAKGAGREYNQSHAKVTEQTEAVGHAVRATYMYSGMADVAALTGDRDYITAIDAIWENVVGRKLYLTGGIGSTASGEAFGKNYELPNMSAYCETCAAIGNAYWNHRLFLLHGQGKYIDVLERTLYNGLLSGVSLDGKGFFYPNPLESRGQHKRSPWFGCACCPGNITRFLASVPGYAYALKGDALYVNLFAAGTAEIEIGAAGKVKIVQQTRYPWDGHVKITVQPQRTSEFTINVRVPGWARNEAVPSDLYRFSDVSGEPVVLKVNGEAVNVALQDGFVALKRSWTSGDVIELELPMPVRRVVANENVEADRGRVALQRGPIVYCAEWADNPDGHVRNLVLPDEGRHVIESRPDLLGGVVVIKARAIALSRDEQGQIARKEQELVAIPYCTWANRGAGEMVVWLANTESAVRPFMPPTIASQSKVSASGGEGREAVRDRAEPKSSGDQSEEVFHWWPRKGTTEWIEYTFARPETVSECEVYWFDDTGRGECRVPVSWRVLYKDGEQWRPVQTAGVAGAEKDRYNKLTFKSVATSGLRVEVTLQEKFSAGIQEWKVK